MKLLIDDYSSAIQNIQNIKNAPHVSISERVTCLSDLMLVIKGCIDILNKAK